LQYIDEMKVAIPQWQKRVSPVFDVAGTLTIIEFLEGKEKKRETNTFPSGESFNRVRLLHQLGVQVLICGAVSQSLESALVAAGIKVIPYICGSVDDVLKAYINGNLESEEFFQPGYIKRKGK
jgi:predicted Fe-Mo cluster-binding NifX family protein